VPTGRVVEREYYGHDAVVRVQAGWDAELTITVRVADTLVLPRIGELVGLEVRGEIIGWPNTDEHESRHHHHEGEHGEHGGRGRRGQAPRRSRRDRRSLG